ncbi:DEKNAAC100141 [Brettanomyces naardenensis]|uniref:DEKNAAC100141 n=1 Tax=Brettanomyces naardenensis TaxID=13370 RepID=A0A448YFC1_BRENA|nr:DEKNAAC100141 [Brettanomyces naardenensis]
MSSTAANVLGTIGTVCWCVQLVPQIITNYRKKNTTGLPEKMAFLWFFCAPFFAVYFVSENASIPIEIQPHLFGILCWIVYIQVMYYPPVSRPKREIIVRATACMLFWVLVEVSATIPLRHLYLSGGPRWPMLIFGIIASIFLALGLIPPYLELWKRQGRVVGIDFVFLTMDFSGAVFSLASLAADPSNFDTMGCILYCICASLELGIFVSHFIWCCRFKWFKKSGGKTAEDELESQASSQLGNSSADFTDIETSVTCVEDDKLKSPQS